MSVGGHNLTFLNLFFGFGDLIKRLLLVTDSFALLVQEKIISSRVVEGQTLFLLLLMLLLLLSRGGHYLK